MTYFLSLFFFSFPAPLSFPRGYTYSLVLIRKRTHSKNKNKKQKQKESLIKPPSLKNLCSFFFFLSIPNYRITAVVVVVVVVIIYGSKKKQQRGGGTGRWDEKQKFQLKFDSRRENFNNNGEGR